MDIKFYQIGELARLANVNIQTIRYYERINLLNPQIRKNQQGARLYTQESYNTLVFIKNAQSIGFQLEEIKDLISLRQESAGRCQKVVQRAEGKLQEVQTKSKHLKEMEKSLKSMLDSCYISGTDDCCSFINKLEN